MAFTGHIVFAKGVMTEGIKVFNVEPDYDGDMTAEMAIDGIKVQGRNDVDWDEVVVLVYRDGLLLAKLDAHDGEPYKAASYQKEYDKVVKLRG